MDLYKGQTEYGGSIGGWGNRKGKGIRKESKTVKREGKGWVLGRGQEEISRKENIATRL